MPIVIKIKGRDQLRAALRNMPINLRTELKTAILDGANEMSAFQKALTPVRTGALRDSIKVTPAGENAPAYASLRSKRTSGDAELAAIVTAGNTRVRYAHLVEFGSAPHTNLGRFPGTANPGAPAQPYFFPGFRATVKSIRRRINAAARKALRKSVI